MGARGVVPHGRSTRRFVSRRTVRDLRVAVAFIDVLLALLRRSTQPCRRQHKHIHFANRCGTMSRQEGAGSTSPPHNDTMTRSLQENRIYNINIVTQVVQPSSPSGPRTIKYDVVQQTQQPRTPLGLWHPDVRQVNAGLYRNQTTPAHTHEHSRTRKSHSNTSNTRSRRETLRPHGASSIVV